MRTSIAVRNANLQNDGDRLNSGFLRFYDGAVPADPDAALGANVLIVELALPNPAMGIVSGAARSFNTIAAGVVAASGTPTFARFFQSDGTTAEQDMTVPDELVLTKDTWTAGEPFPAPSISWTQVQGS